MAWRRSHIEHWSVDHDIARETVYIGIVDEDDVPVAIAIQANGGDRVDEIANLIAAGPGLLGAARKALIDNKCVLPSEDEPQWVAHLRAAILTATGEA